MNQQYQRGQTSYQPTGYVQSVYGQQNRFNNSFSNMSLNNQQNQQLTNAVNQQAFHTANYRGNQQGHDQYLRADATQPTQRQIGGFANQAQSGYASNQNQAFSQMNQNQFGQNQFGQNQFGQNQQNQQNQFGQNLSQAQNPQAFHAANYRGNQAGHDQYLRADATQPSQQQGQLGGFAAQSQSAFNPTSQNQQFNQAQNSQAQNSQAQNPQAFHAANYRGNQAGHDQYLRADATQPTQNQYRSFAGQNQYGANQF